MSYVTSVIYSNCISAYRQIRDCNISISNSNIPIIFFNTFSIYNNNMYSSTGNISRSDSKGNGFISTHLNILRSYSNFSSNFFFDGYFKSTSSIPIACTSSIIGYIEIPAFIRQCNSYCSNSITVNISSVILTINVYNNLTLLNRTTIFCSSNCERNSSCLTSIAFNCCIGYFSKIHVRIEITTRIIFSYLSIICIFIMDSISIESTIIQLQLLFCYFISARGICINSNIFYNISSLISYNNINRYSCFIS